jgi:L-iditol 2-dehydrogenase
MKAAILKRVGVIEMEDIPVPKPGPEDVLVKVKAVGICGSDLHYYTHGKIGSYVVEKPIILGHESAGEVVETGVNVANIRVGDRVTVEPGVPCRKCEYCKTGRYNLCSDVVFMATPPVDGAFTEYIVSPADFVYKIPDTMSYDEAALMEPMAVGVYAAEKAQVKPGMKASVLGLGPIGLVVAQAVKAYGASRTAGVDIVNFRLEKAEQFAVDKAFDSRVEDLEARLITYLGQRPDVVFETAGSPQTITLAANLVKTGGTIILIGMSPEDIVPMNHGQILGKELKILGIFRYANMYPKAIELAATGKVNVKDLATHSFALSETKKAMDFALANKNSSLKVMIHP